MSNRSNSKYTFEKGLLGEIKDADDGTGFYSATYVQVFLNRSTRRVFGRLQCAIGRGTYTVYEDKNIISVGKFSGYISRADLEEKVAEREAEFEFATREFA